MPSKTLHRRNAATPTRGEWSWVKDAAALTGAFKPIDASAFVTSLTPELAGWLLDREKNYRTHQDRRVLAISQKIMDGQWDLNGQTITLSIGPEGEPLLIDGGHRCRAVVVSGAAIDVNVLVVPDVDGVADHIDTGQGRTRAQFFKHHGIPNFNSAAAISGSIWQWENPPEFMGNISPDTPSRRESLETYRQYEDLIQRSITASYPFKGTLSYHTQFALVHALASLTHGGDSSVPDLWLDKISGHTSDSPGTTTSALRTKLIAMRASKSHLLRRDLIAMLIRAYNNFAYGNTVRAIYVRKNFDQKWTWETYPKPCPFSAVADSILEQIANADA